MRATATLLGCLSLLASACSAPAPASDAAVADLPAPRDAIDDVAAPVDPACRQAAEVALSEAGVDAAWQRGPRLG